MIAQILTRLVTVSAAHARLVVLVFVILAGLSAFYTVRNLEVNTDTASMIDPSLPHRQNAIKFNAAFPDFQDTFLIIVDSDAPEQSDLIVQQLMGDMKARDDLFKSVYSPQVNEFFDRSALLYLKPSDLENVTSQLITAQPMLAVISDDPTLRGFFDILASGIETVAEKGEDNESLAKVLEAVRDTVAARNQGEDRVLSWQRVFAGDNSDFTSAQRFIHVQPVLDFTKMQPAGDALRYAREAADQMIAESGNHVEIDITGEVAIKAEELKSASTGAQSAGLLSLLLVSLVLGFGLRSLRLAIAALVTLVIGLVCTAGFAIFAVGYFNLISIAFAVLFIGLGIDFAIHFLLRYQEEIEAGKEHMAALAKTADGVGLALSIAAPTTAIAFFAFTPTDYQGLSQLGLISGTGIVIAYISSLTLLPALLTLMPLKPRTAGTPAMRDAHAGFVERHARPCLAVSVVIGLGAALFAPQVHFDADPLHLKDPNAPSIRALVKLLSDAKTSPYAAQAVAPDVDSALVLAERAEQLPEVRRAITLKTFVPKDQDEKLFMIEDAAFLMGPVLFAHPDPKPITTVERRDAIETFKAALGELAAKEQMGETAKTAQALLDELSSYKGSPEELEVAVLGFFDRTFERLTRSLQTGPVSLADLPDELVKRYTATDGQIRVSIIPDANMSDPKALEEFVHATDPLAPVVTGDPVSVLRSGETVKGAMKLATSLAFGGIFLFLIVILRRVGDSVLVLVPVLYALLVTTGIMVLVDIPFNFANVIILPLLIGIGVDSGVHLMMRRREEGGGAQLLASSTPKAVLLSGLTTIGSFSTLAVSDHRGTASMGELLTISITLTLLSSLVILPSILRLLEERHQND